MKKALLSALLVSLLVSVASAQVFIGSRQAGMGGTGVASATDLTAVYYNPAGLMKAGKGEVRLSLSPSYTDYQSVLDAFSKATDPATFLEDNFANNLSFQGDISGMAGLQVNKIGVSVLLLPLGAYAGDTLTSNNTISISKPAGALQAGATYAVRQDTVFTLGHTFTLPGLAIASLDTGVNIKSINAVYGTMNAAITDTSSSYLKGTGNGTAFDLGARTSLDVPVVGSLAVGLMLRDVGGQIKYSRKQQTYYFNLDNTITTEAESARADTTVTLDSSTVIGASGSISAINLGVAADLEFTKNDTITHLGIEYPLLPMVVGRAGIATGNSVSKTTLGVKLNIPFLTIDASTIMDGKNSSMQGWVIDFGAGF
ncbi:hypothetical protein ACFL37_02100 [Candidatus Margulisiibacteriota bacterium]